MSPKREAIQLELDPREPSAVAARDAESVVASELAAALYGSVAVHPDLLDIAPVAHAIALWEQQDRECQSCAKLKRERDMAREEIAWLRAQSDGADDGR